MGQYIVRRLLQAIPMLLLLSILFFALVNIAPGGPFAAQSRSRRTNPEKKEALKREFGLDKPLPVQYKGITLDCGYRVDLLIEDKLIIELKSVDKIKGIHEAQILTYMKLAGIKTGLLMNFNVTKLKSGIKRFVL